MKTNNMKMNISYDDTETIFNVFILLFFFCSSNCTYKIKKMKKRIAYFNICIFSQLILILYLKEYYSIFI